MPRPPLTISQILAWADAHHARTGNWPTTLSGPVHEAPDETWGNLNQAMTVGRRGFCPKQTLAKVLAKHRGKRDRMKPGDLSVEQILGGLMTSTSEPAIGRRVAQARFRERLKLGQSS